MELLLLKGLPASGKSTFARELTAHDYVHVNKDALRAMLHGGQWSRANERQVLVVRDFIVTDALARGQSVVVDDTNFAPVHAQRMQEIARRLGATYREKFFDVPLEECIKRDLARPNSVGERVIKRMWREYVLERKAAPAHDAKLPWAILCDLDGTLAHMQGRSAFDWRRVGEDTLDESVAEVLRWADCEVILLSGRDSVCRPETEAWLAKHDIPYGFLLMRPQGDGRKDSIVKRELYDEHIQGQYNVRFVLDDRDQVVEMWRDELGLQCFQVNYGDF